MVKSKSILQIGGPLHRNSVQELLHHIGSTGGTYLLRDRTLMSLRSTASKSILKYLEETPVKFIFDECESHEIPHRLETFLKKMELDYRWNWEGYHNSKPGMICADARSGDRVQFLAISEEIVLPLSEASDPDRSRSASQWSNWSPRTLVLYESSHDLIETSGLHLSQTR